MKKVFLVTIDCDDPLDVLHSVGLEVGIEYFMDGYKETGVITDSEVNVIQLNF